MQRAVPFLTMLAAVALLASGCASSPKQRTAAANPEGTPPEAAAWLATVKPIDWAVEAGAFGPQEPGERRFRWTLNAEAREVIRRAEKPGNIPLYLIVSWLDAKSGSLISSQHLAQTNEGNWISGSSITTDRRAETHFKPALPVLPASLDAAKPITTSHEILVSDVDHPTRITHRGRANCTLALAGQSSITVAGKEVSCVVLRSTFNASFGPAVVHRVEYRWYEPTRGLVAQYADERILTLAIETERRQETWIALE